MVIKFIDEHTPFHVSTSEGDILLLITVDTNMESDFIIEFIFNHNYNRSCTHYDYI